MNGTISYLASDGLGSATVTLSSSGTATAAQLFAPYGGVRYSSGSMPTSYGFTGQRSDTASGLDYYGTRYYDPQAGQFTSADSVIPGGGFDLWGLSRYACVEGNPEVRTDSSGHCFCDVPGTGDNFFPQSGGRLLDGDTGYVYYGPGYRQSYHVGTYTARRHHYAPYRPYAATAQRHDSVVGASNPGPVDRAISWLANAVAAPVEADPTEEQLAQSDAAQTGWFNDIAGACGLHCPDPSTPEGQAELAIMLGTDGGWISDKQFGTKAAAHMADFGMDVRDPAQRGAFRKDIINTRGNADEIRQGPWNPTAGGGGDYIFYRKGSTVVVTKRRW